MEKIARWLYFDQRKTILVFFTISLVLGFIEGFILQTKQILITPGMVFVVSLIFYNIVQNRQKLWKTHPASILLYTLIVFLSLYSVIVLTLVYKVLFAEGSIRIFFSESILLFILFYGSYLYFYSMGTSQPLLKSEVISENGFSNPKTLEWLLFTLLLTFATYLQTLMDAVPALKRITLVLTVVSCSFLVLNLVSYYYWVPKGGVARFKRTKMELWIRLPDIIESVLVSWNNQEVKTEDYVDRLIEMKDELNKLNNLQMFQVLAHVIHVAKTDGQRYRRIKFLMFWLLPQIIEEWIVFALLPKHLQRISYDFIEALFFIGELNGEWREIFDSEVMTRVPAKERFALINTSSSLIDQMEGIWQYRWGDCFYVGKEGYIKARERISELTRQWESSSIYQPKAWEKDLETTALEIFGLFFGSESRKAWGGDRVRTVYSRYKHVLSGGKLDEWKADKLEGVKEYRPPQLEDQIYNKPLSQSYLTSYLETGVFPKIEADELVKEEKKNRSWIYEMIGFVIAIAIFESLGAFLDSFIIKLVPIMLAVAYIITFGANQNPRHSKQNVDSLMISVINSFYLDPSPENLSKKLDSNIERRILIGLGAIFATLLFL